MADIMALVFSEKAELESDRLAELYVKLGEAGVQDVVCRAMEELAVKLARIQNASCANDRKQIRKVAKGMIGIAEQVGMQRLADVARDVQNCACENDPVAQGATMARLLRIGDRSLTAAWDLQDLSV